MLSFCSLGSGSKGNAFLVYDGETLLLIDMGRPKGVLVDFLKKKGLSVGDISAILVTHTHIDHVGTLPFVAGRGKGGKPPVYMGNRAYKGVHFPLVPFETLTFGDMRVTPLPTSHDSPDSCGFRIEGGGKVLVYMTDTGYVPIEDYERMEDADYLVLESNHDPVMLSGSSRPLALKKRIRGDKGHLSNDECASLVRNVLCERTKEVLLAHLSEECNTPEIALECTRRVLEEKGREDVLLRVLPQWAILEGGDPWL